MIVPAHALEQAFLDHGFFRPNSHPFAVAVGAAARPGTGQELVFRTWKALSIWPWLIRL